jgi:hypothetical protein
MDAQTGRPVAAKGAVEGAVGAEAAAGPPPAARVLYCVPGAWTDAWYDDPAAWWQWCCAFLGWSPAEWQAFYQRWRSASERRRQQLMDTTGLRFFDWQRVPGGSIKGSARAAAGLIAQDLGRLPPDADVTLLGHSKGGNAIKWLLAAPRDWGAGAKPARAILIDAPVDWLRETVCRWLGLGVERCRLSARDCPIPIVTVNNWLDPSGGRLRGARNYQTLVWQDYLYPYPPHGLKGFLAQRVLRDLGVCVGAAPERAAARLDTR